LTTYVASLIASRCRTLRDQIDSNRVRFPMPVRSPSSSQCSNSLRVLNMMTGNITTLWSVPTSPSFAGIALDGIGGVFVGTQVRPGLETDVRDVAW
jgi:hypothetical protein